MTLRRLPLKNSALSKPIQICRLMVTVCRIVVVLLRVTGRASGRAVERAKHNAISRLVNHKRNRARSAVRNRESRVMRSIWPHTNSRTFSFRSPPSVTPQRSPSTHFACARHFGIRDHDVVRRLPLHRRRSTMAAFVSLDRSKKRERSDSGHADASSRTDFRDDDVSGGG